MIKTVMLKETSARLLYDNYIVPFKAFKPADNNIL